MELQITGIFTCSTQSHSEEQVTSLQQLLITWKEPYKPILLNIGGFAQICLTTYTRQTTPIYIWLLPLINYYNTQLEQKLIQHQHFQITHFTK